MSLMWLK